MKLYNKKKLVVGIVEFLLAIAGVITIIVQKSTDIKFILLSVFCLVLGINSVISSFSKIKSYEDMINDLDERTEFISIKVNNCLLKINVIIAILVVVIGIFVYSITNNITFIITLLPLMILLVLNFIIYIILQIWYEKKL